MVSGEFRSVPEAPWNFHSEERRTLRRVPTHYSPSHHSRSQPHLLQVDNPDERPRARACPHHCRPAGPAGRGRPAGRARLRQRRGVAAARGRARRSRQQCGPRAGQGGQDEAARHRADAGGEDQSPARCRDRGGGGCRLSQHALRAAFLAGRGGGDPEGRRRLRPRRCRPRRARQRRVRVGQPDGAHACRPLPWRCIRGRAGQPLEVHRLRRHARVLHQRCRRPGRCARALRLSALSRGAGREHRRNPGRSLSRRLREAGRRGAGAGVWPHPAELSRGALAAAGARGGHRRHAGRDQGGSGGPQRQARGVLLGALADGGRGRGEGSPSRSCARRASSTRAGWRGPRATTTTSGRIASRRCSGPPTSATMSIAP